MSNMFLMCTLKSSPHHLFMKVSKYYVNMEENLGLWGHLSHTLLGKICKARKLI